MALFKFTKAMLNDAPIDIYNGGEMWRDFTYVGDLVNAISLLIDAVPERSVAKAPAHDSLSPVAPWRVVNIGNSSMVNLNDFIGMLEAELGTSAKRNVLPVQAGDVPATWADTTLLQALTGCKPRTDIAEGIKAFVAWYKEYVSQSGDTKYRNTTV